MVNAFAQGLDALRALRDAELGVPLFAHRVGRGALDAQPRPRRRARVAAEF